MSNPGYFAGRYTIPAGSFVTVERFAEYFVCLEASARFRVAFGDAPASSFEQGLGYNAPAPFHRTRIENPNADELTVEVGWSQGGIRDARVTLSAGGAVTVAAAETLPVTKLGGAGLSSHSVVYVGDSNPMIDYTEILPVDPERRSALIRNVGEHVAWIGGMEGGIPGTPRGLPLEPGETITLETTAAIGAKVTFLADTTYDPTERQAKLALLTIGGPLERWQPPPGVIY